MISLHAMPSSVLYLSLGLMVLSIISWAIIIHKVYYFSMISAQFRIFEQEFWSGTDLDRFYERTLDHANAGEAIFSAGYGSLLQDKKQGLAFDNQIRHAKESMALQQRKWEAGMHAQLAWLATIASVSPYIGLLGTVFGVMHTFQGLLSGSGTQASLSAVAPGISEALAMTALGLFVAIPATVAYNRLSIWFEGLLDRFQLFQDEFILVVQKQA